MTGDAAPLAAARSKPTPFVVLEAMRPKQWIKNAFVLAGLLFSGKALELDAQISAWAAVVSFCLVSSASYLLNDVRDAEVDRHSPRTAGRAIARGDLSPTTALVAAGLAALAGLGIALAVDPLLLAVVGGYVVVQLAYSNGLKRVLFVDVMAIATGFVLRALAGGVAVDVPVSQWLLLCTGLLAVFLGFVKRRGEARVLGGDEKPRRAVLNGYSVALLDELIAVVTPSTVVAYALYAVEGEQSDAMLLTVPFVMYGVFRVLFLVHHRGETTDEPAAIVWRDRPLLACVVLWGAAAAIVATVAPPG